MKAMPVVLSMLFKKERKIPKKTALKTKEHKEKNAEKSKRLKTTIKAQEYKTTKNNKFFIFIIIDFVFIILIRSL